MPDPQPSKRIPCSIPPRTPEADTPAVRYAELHCCTNFSFLEGAAHADELVARAAELGYSALAVTDRHSLAGIVRAHVAAKEAKLKLVVGALIAPIDAAPVLLWATDRPAYGRLAELLTLGRRAAPKGECLLKFDDMARYSDGLLAGVLLARTHFSPSPPASGGEGWGEGGEATSSMRVSPPHPRPLSPEAGERGEKSAKPQAVLEQYRSIFPDRLYAVAELQRGQHDRRRLHQMQQLALAADVPLIAANDVHYHVPQRRPLHDVLTAVRHGCTVAELGNHRFPNGERHLKSPAEMLELFADCPDAVTRTAEVADRCTFSLDELRYDYPEELCPAGLTPLQYLTGLTWDGARRRFPAGIPDKVRQLIEHELVLIAELRYEAYFLTVWDLVRFARERGILCQGRGSAANSVVCYCLGVTSVDPERIDVLFERFVSKERNEAPDIDVDFEHERREEVVQYVYQKYGRDRAGMTAEVITYRERSAVRDVGKALGLSVDRVDRLAKGMDHHHRVGEDNLAGRMREAGMDPDSRLARQMSWLVEQLLGFPRHLSQHVGGLVITHGPLGQIVPIENAAMPDRTVIQWDKNDLDALGILKVDCLALGMLTAIRKCFDLVHAHFAFRNFLVPTLCVGTHRRDALRPVTHDAERPDAGSHAERGNQGIYHSPPTTHQLPLTLANVPPEDPIVYDMICRADTVGVFQIESRGQMSMLPRLKPRCFYDLVIEVAIVRPGPIQGKMVHPYLRRRRKEEAVEYPDERIREVLTKTLGVPLFQEQAMRLAVVAAGFTPGEADQLRRAMGAWRRRGVMEQFRKKLLDGMAANGYQTEFAERVFQQICGFGEYGFPESHAASFALLVYVSAWLKCYYPAAFTAALLNSQPMGFYAPAQLVTDARRHGVEVQPIDVNFSAWDCTLEPFSDAPEVRPEVALRLGLRQVRGLSRKHAERIIMGRAAGPFQSFTDFTRRTGLRAGTLKKLGQADAFGSLQLDRRAALWKSLPEREPPGLFDQIDVDEPLTELPEMTPFAQVIADYDAAGLTLRQHPVSFIRQHLEQLKIVPAAQLVKMEPGTRLKVGGVVLVRQRPGTANGITFVTLEDETGTANLIVRKNIWDRDRQVARRAVAMIAHGTLQRESEVTHVLVTRLEDLSPHFENLSSRSRDFH
jgi:error-prone DNA polymerase